MRKGLVIFGVLIPLAAIGVLAGQDAPKGTPKDEIVKQEAGKKGQEQPQTQGNNQPAANPIPTAPQPTTPQPNESAEASSENLQIQRWLMYLTGALVIVGFLQFLGIILQAALLKQTRSDVSRQADWMETQARHMNSQVELMKEQAKDTYLSAKANTVAAMAADESAKAAMGVAVPTLMLHKFEFLRGPDVRDDRTFLRFPRVEITVKNFGQSPAFLKAWNFRFVWDELPEKPVYDFPYPCDVEEVIEPQGTYTLDPETTATISPTSEEDIDGIIAGKKHLTVYGFVSYGDIFGSPIRYMKFCKQLIEFDLQRGYTLALDHGGYEYTGQHEHYDTPNRKWPKSI
jgi:hypothetical protein